MKALRPIVVLFPILLVPLAHGQKATNKRAQIPVETSVCKIVDDPSAFNNKLVKVRGYVKASLEYSVLLDERCPDNGIWFALADSSGPPGLVIVSRGNGTPGSKDSRGRVTPPIAVRFIRDSNFEELEHYLAISTKGESCADGPLLHFRLTVLLIASLPHLLVVSTAFPRRFMPPI